MDQFADVCGDRFLGIAAFQGHGVLLFADCHEPDGHRNSDRVQDLDGDLKEDEEEDREEEVEVEKPKKKLINLRPQKKVSIQEQPKQYKYKKSPSIPIEQLPPRRQQKHTEDDEDYDYIMYVINNYNKDIQHLISLFDKYNMDNDDKDKLYDAYCVYRDNLDEDLDSFELDKQLKAHLKSVINRNRCIIQTFI